MDWENSGAWAVLCARTIEFCVRSECKRAITDKISSNDIACVINAAAYTSVDKAESEKERAYAVNRDGAGYLARHCRKLGLPLVHISTDYVFDGTKTTAYNEKDIIAPLGIYVRVKPLGNF